MVETTASTLEIKQLLAETQYTFVVSCNNTAGWHGPGFRLSKTTKAEGLDDGKCTCF